GSASAAAVQVRSTGRPESLIADRSAFRFFHFCRNPRPPWVARSGRATDRLRSSHGTTIRKTLNGWPRCGSDAAEAALTECLSIRKPHHVFMIKPLFTDKYLTYCGQPARQFSPISSALQNTHCFITNISVFRNH